MAYVTHNNTENRILDSEGCFTFHFMFKSAEMMPIVPPILFMHGFSRCFRKSRTVKKPLSQC